MLITTNFVNLQIALIVYFGHVSKDGHAPFSSQDFVNLQIAFVPWFANIKLNKKINIRSWTEFCISLILVRLMTGIMELAISSWFFFFFIPNNLNIRRHIGTVLLLSFSFFFFQKYKYSSRSSHCVQIWNLLKKSCMVFFYFFN